MDSKSFLSEYGWFGAQSVALTADASSRRFFRLKKGKETAVMMFAPDPEHRTAMFIKIARLLTSLSLSAPRIIGTDTSSGLVLMEDFGDQNVGKLLDTGVMSFCKLEGATEVILKIQGSFDLSSHENLGLNFYTADLFIQQLGLFFDLFIDNVEYELAPDDKLSFLKSWERPVRTACGVPNSLLLRDFFSGNLMWLASRRGARSYGIIDFQDAGVGPITYDLASLIDDARRDIPPHIVEGCVEKFVSNLPNLDRSLIELSICVLAAVRHVRVIAIFTRLSRQGRKDYIRHLPRVWWLLNRRLEHPALYEVRLWFERFMSKNFK